ncbi:MAG: response regulator [Spirochaetales bacterium]|nr:response regulator [Spirochaetales bacterium]
MGKKNKKVRIFSALEVANICGVVNQTAINWIRGNHLKAFTTPGGQYRVYADDLIDFLQKRGMRVPEDLYNFVKEEIYTVLIIDDDKDLNNMLKDILEQRLSDYKICQAFDGFEAGKMLLEEKPKIIILDINLPGVDGHTLCKKIRADEQFADALIISISGLDEKSEGQQIIKEGADAFFAKPLDFDVLIENLQRLVEEKE